MLSLKPVIGETSVSGEVLYNLENSSPEQGFELQCDKIFKEMITYGDAGEGNFLECISKQVELQNKDIWASSWDYGTYPIDDQRRVRGACASAQSHQSLCCSRTWNMEVDEGSDQKSDI